MSFNFTSRCRTGALVAALLLTSGCKLPFGPGASTESVVKGRGTLEAGAVRLLKVLRADGKPIQDGTAYVDGRAFPIKDGAIAVSETVFQEGQRLGNLLIMAGGYAPVRLSAEAALAGVTLSPLLTLGPAIRIDAAGGKLSSSDGAVAVYVPAGLLDGSTSLALGAYTPGGQDAVAAAYQQDLTKLYRARGQAVPASGSCAAPLACLPIKTALGLSVNVDASASGSDGSGNLKIDLNLRQMLNGWSGQGTPPWETGAAGWTDVQKQNALAAAQLLNAYQALDATGDPSWRSGVKGAFGLALNGDVLTLPVAADPTALLGGFTRVAVPGAELLGVRLEVTLTTTDINSAFGFAADGKPLDVGPDLIPQTIRESGVLDLAAPVADSTGATAVAARAAIALPGVTRTGATLATGLTLAVTAPALPQAGNVSVVTGAATTFDPNTVAGQTSTTQLIANNASGIITNNGSQLVGNNASGIITNNGSQLVGNNASGIVANNGSQLIGNNASGIVANNGGMLTGFPYLPVAPMLAKFQLLAINVSAFVPGIRRTAGGVLEYLWPDALSVRAIDVEGNALTDWVATDGRGAFQLPVKNTPMVFFLECSDVTGNLHVYSQVFAPGNQTALAAVDSSTTLMAISTVHLFNFIPPEKDRLSAIAAFFKASQVKTASAAQTVPTRSKLFQQLAQKVKDFQAGEAIVDSRIAELDASWNAFDPHKFGSDRVAADPVVDTALAIANAKSSDTEAIYTGLYERASTGRIQPKSLLPITLVSPF
ncbi:MAG: hypothetical protein JWM80_3525 [Cyanobacteria bacterium RYN_339]|nr:hypothetical protein [Cyanobacteria bacterium RYN_339]